MSWAWDAVPSFSVRDVVLMGSRERGEGTVSSSFQNVEELSALQFCRTLWVIESSKSRLPKIFRDYVHRAHYFYRKEVIPILKKGLDASAHPDIQAIFGNFTMASNWYRSCCCAANYSGCKLRKRLRPVLQSFRSETVTKRPSLSVCGPSCANYLAHQLSLSLVRMVLRRTHGIFRSCTSNLRRLSVGSLLL